jgi:hypothetical protein
MAHENGYRPGFQAQHDAELVLLHVVRTDPGCMSRHARYPASEPIRASLDAENLTEDDSANVRLDM